MTDEPEKSDGKQDRDGKGRRRRGVSGNLKGKPQGALNKATLAAEALIDDAAERLTEQALTMALGGDTTALKLCMDRLLPPRRDRPVNVALPEVDEATDLAAVTARLLEATASGELTPSEASELSKVVETHRRTTELVELEQRIARLEEQTVEDRK